MARKRNELLKTGRTVLLIDDSREYLDASRQVIEREGHTVLTADGGLEAIDLLRACDVDLVLVDFLMPGMTGEEFVRRMREFRPSTQVVLQTGYANEHPPRELLRRLDIQGFHDKSDGPEKLLLWVDVGLKAAFSTQLLLKSRMGLRYVLDVTPALHRIQPLQDLLQGVLLQMAGLLGATDTFVAAVPPPPDATTQGEGFVAMAQESGEPTLRAATGRFAITSVLDEHLLAQVRSTLSAAGVVATGSGTMAPLRVGTRSLGVVYLDRAVPAGWETEIVEVFANQAAVAIHNVSLYEMAALDALTGVATRRFFDQALTRELHAAWRSGAPLGLLVVDVDDMKTINDTHGHIGGDAALRAVGSALRRTTRVTDVVGRIGGDEFVVALPGTDPVGVEIAARRVRDALSSLSFEMGGRKRSFGASVGAAVLAARSPAEGAPRDPIGGRLEPTIRTLLHMADAQMYAHKRGEGAEPTAVRSVPWPVTTSAAPVPA